jgi:hypothetical protein
MKGCNSVFVGFPEFSEFLFPRFKNMKLTGFPVMLETDLKAWVA